MTYRKITIHTRPEGLEDLENALIIAGYTSFEVSDARDFNEFLDTVTPHWDYVDEALLEKKTAPTTVSLYLEENEPTDRLWKTLSALKAEKGERVGTLAADEELIYEEQWKDVWKQYYRPVEVSEKLAVVPEWMEYTPRTGQTVLWMDPGAAFGTGSHETTFLCLSALAGMDLTDKTVLDIGSGSGILSVASLLLGAKKALGVDVDELAVRAGGENAARNGVADRAAFIKGDLAADVTEQFDIVAANIVSDVLLRLLPDARGKMAAGGKLLLSGVIDDRAAELREAIGQNGLRIVREDRKNDWHAFLCEVDL